MVIHIWATIYEQSYIASNIWLPIYLPIYDIAPVSLIYWQVCRSETN